MSQQPVQPFDPTQLPTHPDYQRLVDLLTEGIELVAQEQDGQGMQEYVSQYADAHSVAHISIQRAMGMFEFETPQQFAAMMPEIMKASVLYMEGFTLGVQFEQGNAGQDGVLARVMQRLLAEPLDAGGTWVEVSPEAIKIDATIEIDPIEHATIQDVVQKKET